MWISLLINSDEIKLIIYYEEGYTRIHMGILPSLIDPGLGRRPGRLDAKSFEIDRLFDSANWLWLQKNAIMCEVHSE